MFFLWGTRLTIGRGDSFFNDCIAVFSNPVGAVVLLVLTGTLVMKGRWRETFYTVYFKEIGVVQGKEKSEMLFQGWARGWKVALEEFSGNPIYLQLVGDGSHRTGTHNDFNRALLGTGIIGLVFYILLLGVTGVRTLLNCWRNSSPLNTVAVMLIRGGPHPSDRGVDRFKV